MTKTVFISYSWDSPKHQEWVLSLASNLVTYGVNVYFDQYDLSIGKDVTHFMEKAMIADWVLVVLTPNYKVKADGRKGGVGYEYSMLTSEYYENVPDKTRILPILREGDKETSCPAYMKTKMFHDMRADAEFDPKLFELIRRIVEKPVVTKPPLGQLPDFDVAGAPDIEKTLLDFKTREKQLIERREFLRSIQAAQMFRAESDNVVNFIQTALDSYKKNFGFHFIIRTGNHPTTITFTTGRYTAHFSGRNESSDTAENAHFFLSLTKGAPGFDEYRLETVPQAQNLYKVKYKFDVNENFIPLFIREGNPNIKLTTYEISTSLLRDLITKEIAFRENRLK